MGVKTMAKELKIMISFYIEVLAIVLLGSFYPIYLKEVKLAWLVLVIGMSLLLISKLDYWTR